MKMLLADFVLLFLVKCVCSYFLGFILFQTDNMAREGLRTLVVAKKQLTDDQYRDFEVSQKHLIFVSLNARKKHSFSFNPLCVVSVRMQYQLGRCVCSSHI